MNERAFKPVVVDSGYEGKSPDKERVLPTPKLGGDKSIKEVTPNPSDELAPGIEAANDNYPEDIRHEI